MESEYFQSQYSSFYSLRFFFHIEHRVILPSFSDMENSLKCKFIIASGDKHTSRRIPLMCVDSGLDM